MKKKEVRSGQCEAEQMIQKRDLEITLQSKLIQTVLLFAAPGLRCVRFPTFLNHQKL